jgi:hypothetical protein
MKRVKIGTVKINRATGEVVEEEPSAPVAGSAWRPIQSAPKDGTEVLLAVKLRAGVPGKLLVGHYMPGGHCIEDHPAIDAGWYFWNGCMFDKAAKPTHWMPLPEPPNGVLNEQQPHKHPTEEQAK